MSFIEILKAIAFGIVEGFTEWLPISSTAHMMILDEFIKLDATPEFKALFMAVIQFGAVMAIIVLYFRKLNPFDSKKKPEQKAATWRLWLKIAIATLPAAVLGLLLSGWIEETMYNGLVVAITLIFLGVVFIVFEHTHRYTKPDITRIGRIDYQTALYIGFFQVLALIPGTSRSGAVILGAMILGCSRGIAAEFSFFLAIPVILGRGLLMVIEYEGAIGSNEAILMIVGALAAFIVAIYSVRFMLNWIKKNSYTIFGYYRIGLGTIILIWYIISGLIKA